MIEEKITADWKKLMEDGAGAASYFLSRAIESIDGQFGAGYSKQHPELVGAFMNAAAKDSAANTISKCIQQHAEELADGLNDITFYIKELSEK